MTLTGNDLRREYLRFFESMPGAAHKLVGPAPLIPPDDPTLLFTSAGMVQFKRLYSGEIAPLPYSRAASCQPCLRAGGKGSDLENVGKTLRHHTLFEMLGNFSFGDYFKREAIRWAWQFVTEVMKLPRERLFPTIFEDDDEAEALWREETDCLYTPVRLDAAQNFWGPAGDTGACGPCSELCFFMGTDEELRTIQEELKKSEDAYTPVLAKRIDEEGDLFLEIWNMVFPQFDQQRDGSRPLLKNRGIDTGAGLERMTTVSMWMQGKASTPYETDLLWPIVSAAAELVGVKYLKVLDEGGGTDQAVRARLGVNAIADHVRALCFCLEEGIAPGNVGRGYVVRRIARRALRFASLLGNDDPFMDRLVDPVIEAMGGTYPGLKEKATFLRKAVRIEEESFLKTRNRGMKLLDELIANARDSGSKIIGGAEAFKLWDTYGFPLDMTEEVARDAGLSIDRPGYEKALGEQKERGRASWQGEGLDKEADAAAGLFDRHGETKFTGYAATEENGCAVIAIIADGALVENASEGTRATLVLDRTPFYAESGGQIGDTGTIEAGAALFEVADTQKTGEGVWLHRGEVRSGTVRAGDTVACRVDAGRRMHIRRNHSTTHLLQSALKKHVGDHCKQAGSHVAPDGLRFDFAHHEAVSADTLRLIQEEVNRLILGDYPVTTEVLSLEDAKKKGAIAPFGEKYGPTVRVVRMGDGDATVSLEFCGGTHLDSTGQAARFRIVSEGSIASGVRRIEAVTGRRAAELELEEQYDVLQPLQNELAAKGSQAVERVKLLQARVKQLEKDLARERQKAAAANLDRFVAAAVPVGDAMLATAVFEGLDGKDLKTVAMALQEKMGGGGIALAFSKEGGKIGIVAAVGADARKAYPAGKVVNAVAGPLGGKGGGKPDLAQAGAKDSGSLEEIVARAPELVAAL